MNNNTISDFSNFEVYETNFGLEPFEVAYLLKIDNPFDDRKSQDTYLCFGFDVNTNYFTRSNQPLYILGQIVKRRKDYLEKIDNFTASMIDPNYRSNMALFKELKLSHFSIINSFLLNHFMYSHILLNEQVTISKP